jgi:hypothetical protein
LSERAADRACGALLQCNISLDSALCSAHIGDVEAVVLRLSRPLAAARPRGSVMTTPTFEEFQKFSKQQLDAVNAAAAGVAKGLQEIAAESSDYSKKAFATSSATVEKLLGAKSVETAVQIQNDFAKSTFEGFVAQANKINEIYIKLATEAFKPVEAAFTKLQVK